MRCDRKWALVALVAMPFAQAADETGKGYITPPQIGWVWVDNDRNVDDDRYYGLGIGKHLGERWSLELNGIKSRHESEGAGELELTAVGVDGLRVFRRANRVSPFFSVGAGYIVDNPDFGARQRDWMGQVGAGLLVDVAENSNRSFLFQLRPEIKVRWDRNDMIGGGHPVDYLAGVAFSFAFGAESGQSAREAAPAPERSPPPPPRPDVEPEPVVEPPAPPPVQEPVVLRDVQFATESAQLTAASRPVLDELARQLQRHANLKIEVQGHTDSLGDAAYNLDLSERRAEAVAAYLVGRGVPADRLSPRGYGETQPIADNSTPAGRAANRRVAWMVIENPSDARILLEEQ